MNHRIAVLSGLLICGACSAGDVSKAGSDVADLTASNYLAAPVASVSVSPATTGIAVGASTKLDPVMRDSKGARLPFVLGSRMVWSSSDTTVAHVSAVSGIVTGLKDGVATITVATGSASGASQVTVGTGSPEATVKEAAQPSSLAATAVSAGSTASSTFTSTPPATAPTAPATAPTAPATAPTAPATAPTAPADGISKGAFLFDNFTRYSSTADLFANISTVAGGGGTFGKVMYGDGHNADLIELDRTTLYKGHPTIKYNQPGGTAATPALWPGFPDGRRLNTMWFRAKIKFSPGFTTVGTLTNSSNAYKLLGWSFSGVDGSGRVEITNTNQYQIYFGGTNRDGTRAFGTDKWGFGGNVSGEWTDGLWYDYIVEYEVTSPTTARARVWISKDGQTPVLRATALGSASPGQVVQPATGVMLGLNFNQERAASQAQAVWYGEWQVVDGDQYPNPFGLAGY